MRMWMVDPKIMCRQHLLGEHLEHHMFLGHMKRGKRVDGYLSKNCLEICSLHDRHEELSVEIERRGWKHKSPFDLDDYHQALQCYNFCQINALINQEKSLNDLLTRCERCRRKYNEYLNNKKVQV